VGKERGLGRRVRGEIRSWSRTGRAGEGKAFLAQYWHLGGGSGSCTEASSGTIGVIYGSQSRYLNGQRCQVDSVQAQRVHLSHTSLYFVSLDTLYYYADAQRCNSSRKYASRSLF